MKRSATWNRLLSVFLVLAMLLSLAAPAMAAENDGISYKKVDNSSVKNPLSNREAADISEEEETYAAGDVVRVSIFLKKAATIEAGYEPANIAANSAAMAYRAGLKADQNALVQKIEKATGEKLDVVWNLTLAANLISAWVEYGQIEAIEAVRGVEKVVIETEYAPDVVSKSDADPNMATSSKQIGSAAAWAAGYTGAGSKVAIIDTGMDLDHEAFDPDAFDYSMDLLDGEYDLLTVENIEAVLSELHVASNYTAEDLYANSKAPFAYSYVDNDLDVSHYNSEHGSHVAGISAANAYVKVGQEFKPSLQTTGVQGVAPDAQILVMQVFGDNGGAYNSDYMVAIEDAIILGADSVNLSLGSGNPGMSSDADYQEILDGLAESGVVVVMSAGNSGAWSDATPYGYLYSDDVSMHTGGSPGTYTNSLGVASVDNDGATFVTFEVAGLQIVYQESLYSNKALFTLAGEQEFVLIDGLGKPEDWAAVGDALEGKVAFCSRGETSFFEKANAAVEAGAIAVVIYNNQAGTLGMDLTGYKYTAPVVSITQNAAAVIKAEATAQNGYYTGKMTINPGPSTVQYNSEYYTMSDFSSWGVPGSLEMKPEITAPGGYIYSVAGYVPGLAGTGHTAYESMSGTSMAAPQVAGMVAVLTQYFRESGLVEKTGEDARVLAQSLLMSTAEPVMEGENDGYYYSILKQGAGLANVGNAVSADSYILMGKDATASYADGKVKAELGDDPDRTGVYTFSFTINNFSDKAQNYALSADVFTQAAFSYNNTLFMDTWTAPLEPTVTWKVDGKMLTAEGTKAALDFNGDGTVTDADGEAILEYVVGNKASLSNQSKADLSGDGEITTYDAYLFFTMVENDAVTVAANDSVTVEVTIALSDTDKEYLDTYYTNGAYVEAFVYAEGVADEEGVEGTSHSIPVLGFYGNWTEASMFDKGSYMEYAHGEETRTPYLYGSNGTYSNNLGLVYADDPASVYYFGGNPAVQDETYMPERNAISATSKINDMEFTAIRNAAESVFFIKDAQTGAYMMQQQLGGLIGAYYFVNGGYWTNTHYSLNLGMSFGSVPNDTALELGITLIPEYYIDSNGNYDLSELEDGATFSMPFVVDNTAPAIVQSGIKLSSDKKTLTVTASDNQYVAAVAMYDKEGTTILSYTGAFADAEKGEALEYTLDVSEINGNGFLIQVIDYAYNISTYILEEKLGEIVDTVDGIDISASSAVIMVGEKKTLTATVLPVNASDRSVTWKSSDETVATVDTKGVVTAVAEGTATITATSNLDPTKSASCSIEVIDIKVDLNGIVWDEVGSIWYSKFNTNDLPNYEKLSGDLVQSGYFVSATTGPDGTIYAGTEEGNYTGALYKIDPTTYAATKMADANAGIDLFYADLTYAPEMLGEGYLLGVYGKYVVLIDPVTGECLGAIDQFDEVLIGIASCYGMYDGEDSMNAVYVITASGTIIQEIYYYIGAYDQLIPYYDAMYGERATFETGINKGEAIYFNSAYYDGQYLYWSAFEPDVDSQVTLYAIDEQADFAVYELGKFAADVWPVAGLHQTTAAGQQASAEDMAQIKAVITEKGMPEVQQIQMVKMEQPADKEVKGGLNSVSNYQAPTRPQAAEDEETVTVTVTAKNAEGVEVDSTNGMITVTYDPTALTLKEIAVSGQYSAVHTDEEGTVVIAYVGPEAISAGDEVATLVFENNATKDEQIVVEHNEYADKKSGYTEKFGVKAAVEQVQWHSVSTTLSGNIGLNFYAKLSEEMLKDEDAFIRFTFADKVVEVPMSAAVAAERGGETVYRFTCPVTSKNMSDVVTAQFMNANGVVGKAVSESVQSYCEYMIENYNDAKLVALMKAMLNYGASAQVLFNYKTDNLANANLSAADKVLAEVDASAHAYVKTGSEEGIKPYMATLLLDSDTTVRVYYELTGDKTIDQYTFTIDGKEVTPTAKGNLYYIEVKGVSAHKLDEMFTFTVGGLTLKCSALSYVDMVLEDPEGSTEAMMNNAKALYAYSAAAENYIK